MASRKPFELGHFADPCPTLPIETGVGSWVCEKHTYLAKYISATHGHRAKWGACSYIDLYCGPGRVHLRDEPSSRAGGATVAWEYARAKKGAFTTVVINDLDTVKSEACRSRLGALGAPVVALNGGAEAMVAKAIQAIDRNQYCLAYLDPYSLRALSFETIRQLATLKHVDILLHFSVMDLSRNARMELDLDRDGLDAAAPGWRDQVEPKLHHRDEPFNVYFRHWCSLVQKLGFMVSERMPLVRNDRNAALYRLLLLSRHADADRIWGDVGQGPTKELF